ncbi:MAG: Asp-tRNA(Asn)/Glu-tRNA(Gln) amidotransferase GatCAB subunit C [Promethearchaeota archaeon Loki_b32]|nr:MAG: Asp-tRNA(Asn)/Glu-tRNA(Gln) amidotransferase GatCAB subunit C [Candidatus Lokiarchaeota archaeon Loki_b32]
MSEKEEFSKETIDHISKLALLDLSDDEKEKLAIQLGDILNYFKKLDDLDTSNVKPMTHPIDGLKNVFREDIIWKSLSNEEALKNAKYKKDGYIKAPRILKEK